jgi:uncharacterized protein with NRDE domain
MCVIALAWNAHPRWRLLLVGNRDEAHARPSAALAHWDDAPILGGRDLEAGGTWLGVTAGGRCSVVTNVRNPRDPQLGLSRGLLVSDYLSGNDGAARHAEKLRLVAADYRPFNLLTFDATQAFLIGNRPGPQAQPLSAGVHGLSNAQLDTPWPKTKKLCEQLQHWLDADDGKGQTDDFSPLFDALADERLASDAQLPDTGIGLERERWLSSVFIRGESYGTRASTIVAIDHAGGGVIIERQFGVNGHLDGQNSLPIERSFPVTNTIS